MPTGNGAGVSARSAEEGGLEGNLEAHAHTSLSQDPMQALYRQAGPPMVPQLLPTGSSTGTDLPRSDLGNALFVYRTPCHLFLQHF